MKKKLMLRSVLCWTALLTGTSSALASLNGTYTINSAGSATATNYQSITSAISDMVSGSRSDGGPSNGAGVSGAVIFELPSTFTSSSALTFGAVSGASSTNTITIRPASGVSSVLSITSSGTTITIDNGDYYIIDGRPGGTGSNKYIEITSSTTADPTVSIINDATNNIIRYCTITGANLNTASGVVWIGGTTGSTGNDDNSIISCNMDNSAAGIPVNMLMAQGTSGMPNNNCTIYDCAISDYFATGVDNAGIYIKDYNQGWSISWNSIFQTATRTSTNNTTVVHGIYLNASSDNLSDFTISSNYIGGSETYCGSTAWTQVGNYASTFRGIHVNASGSATNNSIQENTITNFDWTSTDVTSTAPGVWSGIHISSGSADIGTEGGNRIGTEETTGSILITNNHSTDRSITSGISSSSTGTINISFNEIGSITTACSTVNAAANIYGIWAKGNASYTVSGNNIGISAANSINTSAASTNNFGQSAIGILFNGNSSNTATNNTIANIHNNYVGPGYFMMSEALTGGIRSTSGSSNIFTGNTIRNISSTSRNTDIRRNASVVGIATASFSSATHITSGNTVYNLFNTNTNNVNAAVVGIYMGGGNSSSVADANLIHSLSVPNSTQGYITGFHCETVANISNNMIRLGIDASGTSIGDNHYFFGFYDASNANFYHNSVYTGGTVSVSSSASTYAYYTQVSAASRSIINNIFVNNRSNGSGGTATHNAAVYANTIGYTIDNNIYRAAGTGGELGGVGIGGQTTLSGFQGATGQDANSVTGDPLFIDATGSAVQLDLHLSSGTPAEAAGANIASSVPDDFDGSVRSTLSPHDIGADANDFNACRKGNAGNSRNTADNTVMGKSASNVAVAAQNAPDMQFIPNPAYQSVKLTYKNIEGAVQLRLTNVTGKLVYTTGIDGGTGSVIIPLQNLPAGIYVAELHSKNGRLTQKLIKE